MTDTITTTTVPEHDFDAAAAFEGLLGADEPKREEHPGGEQLPGTEVTAPDIEGQPAALEAAEGEDTTSKQEPRAALAASDEDELEVTVNGAAQRVAVKDLKALFERHEQIAHQQTALEARQQAVSAEAERYTTALQSLAQSALTRYNEYAKIDWVDARLALPPAQYQALRAEAERATQEAQYFEGQITQVVQQQRDAQLSDLRERAVAAVKVLKDPATGIAGWNDGLYKDIQDYAVNSLGAPRDLVQSIVDPWAIKAIHAAMLYNKGQASLKATPATAKPVVPASGSRTITATSAPRANTPAELSKSAAMARLRDNGGDMDAAAAAFMAIL